MAEESVRIVLEVQAGIVPGQAEEEFTRRWAITTEQWDKAKSAQGLSNDEILPVLRSYGEANEYMRMLWEPGRLNWVRLDWLYL